MRYVKRLFVEWVGFMIVWYIGCCLCQYVFDLSPNWLMFGGAVTAMTGFKFGEILARWKYDGR